MIDLQLPPNEYRYVHKICYSIATNPHGYHNPYVHFPSPATRARCERVARCRLACATERTIRVLTSGCRTTITTEFVIERAV